VVLGQEGECLSLCGRLVFGIGGILVSFWAVFFLVRFIATEFWYSRIPFLLGSLLLPVVVRGFLGGWFVLVAPIFFELVAVFWWQLCVLFVSLFLAFGCVVWFLV
jgi:hypothetical protein